MVEDVLVQLSLLGLEKMLKQVLILVVVEDVLVLHEEGQGGAPVLGLNPCCGGRCSSTVEPALPK